MSLIIKRSLSRPYYFLQGEIDPVVFRAMRRALTYIPADAARRLEYRRRNEDGILEECLLGRAITGDWYFPVGVLGRVIEILDVIGMDYRVQNDVELPGDPLGLEWKTDKVLYDYQAEAAEIAYLNGGGTICLPTGGGKTLVCLRLIYAFDHRALVMVHSRELMRQWRDEIRRTFDIDPGLVGGGFKENWDDITVASIQTIASRVKRGKVDEIDLNYPVAVLDECLPYKTPVITDRGAIPIGVIVEQRLPVRVLTHAGRYRRVTAHHKIPLRNRLVRVIHDCGALDCTEDHKIYTQRGWVEAINLVGGDVVSALAEGWDERHEVYMRNLREEVCESLCSRGTRGPCSFAECVGDAASGCECILEQGVPGGEKADGPGEPGEEMRISTRDGTDRGSATVDPGWAARGYEYSVSKQTEQISTHCGLSGFCASRVHRVEICDNEKPCWYSTQDRCESGIPAREHCASVSDPLTTVPRSNVRFGEARGWKENGRNSQVVGRDRFPDGTGGVVSGRRIVDKECEQTGTESVWTQRSDFGGICGNREGEPYGGVVGSGVGDTHENTFWGEGGEGEAIFDGLDQQEFGCRCVPGYRSPVCCSLHALQGDKGLYVYDLTVEEDHSFVASGICVSNCHRVPAQDSYTVAMLYNSPVRIGASATPYRTDGREMKIWGAIGDICVQITPVDLIRRGYLTRPRFVILDPPYVKMRKVNDWHDAYYDGIVANQYRNQMIVNTARSLVEDGHKVYIHVERIEHGDILAIMFDDVPFIHGTTPKAERDGTIAQFAGTELDCLISTLLGEGVDIPAMTAIIMAGGLKTQVGVVQKVGRALRLSPGKEEAIIVDFRDKGPWLSRHFQERMNVYRESYGEYVGGRR